MRIFWGALSLLTLVLAVGAILLAFVSTRQDGQLFGGLIGIVALLIAYGSGRLAH